MIKPWGISRIYTTQWTGSPPGSSLSLGRFIVYFFSINLGYLHDFPRLYFLNKKGKKNQSFMSSTNFKTGKD
jgi:hypothetical protein